MQVFDSTYWRHYITRMVNRDFREEPIFELDEELPRKKINHLNSPKSRTEAVFENIIFPTIKVGKSFSDVLFHFINTKKVDEVKLYQKIGISRSVFSKIRSDNHYQPERNNVYRFAIGLELNLDESILLLQSAGYHYQFNSRTSLVVRHCIANQIYDLMLIDEILVFNQENPLFSEK